MEKDKVKIALACCAQDMCQGDRCPYFEYRCKENDNCLEKMSKDALSYINELEETTCEQEDLIKNMDLEILVRRETANKSTLEIVDYAVEKITEAMNGS